jgi:hypothetical protein
VAAVGGSKTAAAAAVATTGTKAATAALDDMFHQWSGSLGSSSANGVDGAGGDDSAVDDLVDVWDVEALLADLGARKND